MIKDQNGSATECFKKATMQSMESTEKCIRQRFTIARLMKMYYDFVVNEVIPVDYDLYEDTVNSAANYYIDSSSPAGTDHRDSSRRFLILFQSNYILSKCSSTANHIEAIGRRYQNMRRSLKVDKVPLSDDEMKEVSRAYVTLRAQTIHTIVTGDELSQLELEFDKYVSELYQTYCDKDYTFIVVLMPSFTRYIHIYRSKYPDAVWYDPYVALRINPGSGVSKDVHNVAKMLEAFNAIATMTDSSTQPRKEIDKHKTLDDLVESMRGNDSQLGKTPGMCKAPDIDEIYYFAYYHITGIADYILNNDVVDSNTKKTDVGAIVNNALKVRCNVVNIVFTEKMMRLYTADKSYLESKIASNKNKVLRFYVDLNLMYNPLESNLVPHMERMDENKPGPEITWDKSLLPKLDRNKDISVKYMNLRKGDVVKISSINAVQYKVVI